MKTHKTPQMFAYQYRNIILASLLFGSSDAFVPSNIARRASVASTSSTTSFGIVTPSSNNVVVNSIFQRSNNNSYKSPSFTSLHMSNDDFNESKYTESAWACMIALTKVAEFYTSTTVDSQMLLDVMLNPTKHNAGEDAEGAKRVAEKVLMKADINPNTLRQELEVYMSKQPKISGSMDAQKVMGRSMVNVLDRAREIQPLLGVSFNEFML